MKDSVFLSYPKPYLEKQKQFIEKVVSYLENRGLQPRTLGVTDYDMDAPLTAILFRYLKAVELELKS